MKPIVASLILLNLFISSMAIAATPDETIRATTLDVLSQLSQDRSQLTTDPESIQQVVNELIIPHFDFTRMSALVLASHWDELNEDRQLCFVAGFRNTLVERYAYILLSYDDQNISYEPAREVGEQGTIIIRQTISREGAAPLPVDYAMQQTGAQWKVVDLIVDGVSLAGAACELSETLIVNPYDIDDMVAALETALSMPLNRRREIWHVLMKALAKNDVFYWAESFLTTLKAKS